MAAFFEKRTKRQNRHPKTGYMPDRYETEEDLKALARKKKIEKDLERHNRVKQFAREKLKERQARGREQSEAQVKGVDMTVFDKPETTEHHQDDRYLQPKPKDKKHFQKPRTITHG